MDHEMALMLGEMRGDLKSLLRQQNEINEKIAGLAERVENNERSILKFKTVATIVGALAGLFAGKMGELIAGMAGILGA